MIFVKGKELWGNVYGSFQAATNSKKLGSWESKDSEFTATREMWITFDEFISIRIGYWKL